MVRSELLNTRTEGIDINHSTTFALIAASIYELNVIGYEDKGQVDTVRIAT